MSREVALDTINLKSIDRIAHTDYSLEYHVDYIVKKTGLSLDNPDTLSVITTPVIWIFILIPMMGFMGIGLNLVVQRTWVMQAMLLTAVI